MEPSVAKPVSSNIAGVGFQISGCSKYTTHHLRTIPTDTVQGDCC